MTSEEFSELQPGDLIVHDPKDKVKSSNEDFQNRGCRDIILAKENTNVYIWDTMAQEVIALSRVLENDCYYSEPAVKVIKAKQ